MTRQRTALYVYEPSTVTIRAKECNEPELLLCRYGRKFQRIAEGALALDGGIYLLLSSGQLDIIGGNTTITPLSGKDVPPEPRLQVIGLEQGATAASIKQFFAVDKGIDIGDPPPEPVSPAKPDADEVADEPDDT
jgi:hypothetical protein